jgi:hypothetical protein
MPGPYLNLLLRLSLAVYLFWAGLFLLLAPWTALWEHNFFGNAWPSLGAVMQDRFVRGGVTGVGLITALGGMRELLGVFLARASSEGPKSS